MAYDFDFSTSVNLGSGAPRLHGIAKDVGTFFDPAGPYGGYSLNSTVSDEAGTFPAETSQTGKTGDGSEFQDLINFIYGPKGRAYRREAIEDQLMMQKQQMAEAGKYKALFETPDKIARAFTVPAAISLAGDVQAAATMMQGTQQAARLYAEGIKPLGINVGTTNYNYS